MSFQSPFLGDFSFMLIGIIFKKRTVQMNKVFNRLHTPKSSENCDKYSKSVSYETLVGGTATIGRECSEALEIEGIITRRTSVRRGYLPR